MLSFTPKRLKLLHIFVSTCLAPLWVFAAIFYASGHMGLALGASWFLSGVAALWHLRGGVARRRQGVR